jgi:hypothetical protein
MIPKKGGYGPMTCIFGVWDAIVNSRHWLLKHLGSAVIEFITYCYVKDEGLSAFKREIDKKKNIYPTINS